MELPTLIVYELETFYCIGQVMGYNTLSNLIVKNCFYIIFSQMKANLSEVIVSNLGNGKVRLG